MDAARKPGALAMRPFAAAGKAIGYGALFVLLLCVGVLLHVDVPVARKLAAKEVSDGLATLFEGKIVLEHVDDLGVKGVRGADAYVTAPDGTKVIVAHGLRARIDAMALVRTILAGKGVIGVFDIEIDDATVVLDEDATGVPKIARAFTFAKPLPPPDGKQPPFKVELVRIHLRHVWLHGHITGAPLLDGDADNVQGSVRAAADGARVEVTHVDLTTRGAPANANAVGVVTGYVVLPSARGAMLGLGGTFDGLVGQVAAHGRLDLDGNDWSAAADVPLVDAAKVRAMLPTAPLYAPLALHAEASGPLDTLHIKARANLGASTVDASALLTLGKDLTVKGHVDATDVDIRNFAPTAPASRLGTSADVELHAQSGQPMLGSYTLTTPVGSVDGATIPATDLRGTFEQRSSSGAGDPGFAATATGKILEPGAPTDVTLSFHPGKGGGSIDVNAHTVVASLGGVRRIGWVGAGRADVVTKGVMTIAATPRFDANVRATVNGFRRDELRVEQATISGHAAGTFTAPAFEATVDATNVREERFTWNHASATASGSPANFGVTVSAHGVDTPSVEGHATVGVGAVTTITDADVTLRRRTTAMQARVAKVRIGRDLLDVHDAELTGVGEPLRGSLTNQGGVLTLQALSAGLNLHDVAYLFRADDHLKQGVVAFAVDARTTGGHGDGAARFNVTGLTWDEQQGIAVSGEVTLHGRDLNGRATATVAGLGNLHVNEATIHVGGKGPLLQSSWRSSWGDVSLDGSVDIPSAVALLPANTLPPVDLSGTLDFAVHTSRASATDDAPSLAVTLQTRRLLAARKPAWELRGVDVTADVTLNGGSGKLSARATDVLGTLVTVEVESKDLPYAALIGPDSVSALMQQPMTAHVHVPPRELATLPLLVRPAWVRGFLELDATARGPALAPTIALDASARAATFTAMPDAKPMDLAVHGTYGAKVADLAVDVSSPLESYLHLTAHANADLGVFVTGKIDPAWNGSAKATLVHFPLGAIADLSDLDIGGRVSGEVEVTRYHDDARATAKLEANRLTIGRTRFSKVVVEAAYDGNMLDAHARFDEKDGFAELTGKMAMGWGRELRPKPAPLDALSLTVAAKHLQASFLEPVLASTVDELDGLIDGDARLELALGKQPTMSGNVLLHDARVVPSATGEELHGVNAKVTLAQDGTLALTDLVALGTTGKVTGSGGAHLAGVSLTDATLKLAIAKKDALPLSLGGSVLGSGYGGLSLTAATSASGNTKVKIDVPEFHVELPEVTPRAVQDLEPPPDNLHVGVYTGTHEFKVLGRTRDHVAQKKAGESPRTLEVAIRLGNVDVSRGTDLRAALGGETTMEIADKTTMRGQITLKSGKLDVQGKPFEIQKGTATFVGDPQNPEVNLTASWKAADGTEVFADYIGPLKTGKVVLRSEPPRPQNEIVSLILFGSSDGAQSTPYAQQQTSDPTTTVGSAVGGFATGGLNEGIDKLTGMDISTKIDTSQANPRPEVELRIARDLSLQIAFVLGTPPPGTNQDTTYATIDWRFFRNWSLATTFGNLGSSMADILWRYRY